MKRFWGLSVLVVLTVSLSFVIGGLGTAQSPGKLAPDLAKLVASGSNAVQPIIVQTHNTPNSDDEDNVKKLGGKVKRAYKKLKAYAAELPLPAVPALASNSRVKWISPNRSVRAFMAWSNVAARVDVAWANYGVSGNGVGIAVLDTGVMSHGDLNGRLTGWTDFVTNSSNFMDDNGHGTHVAGIAAGNGAASVNGNYSTRFYGVAPGANVIGVKVLDVTGQGIVSNVIAGIDWCIANKTTYNIRVMSLSLGQVVAENYVTDPLCQAVERAWTAGIVVVCAAGNQGRSDPTNPDSPPAYGTIDCPGNDPYVITVGATNTRSTMSTADDVMASYSSKAPAHFDHILKPDLLAPGNRVVSLLASGSYLDTSYPQNEVDPATYSGSGSPQYFILSGTSMATPMVAGAAALMLEREPTLTPDTVKARLMVSANKVVYNRDGTPANIFTRGTGQLDVAAALAQTGAITSGYCLSPIANRASRVGLYQLFPLDVLGNTALGTGDASWSDSAIWGSNVDWADPTLYPHGLWGDNILWEDNIIWSDNIIWADKYPYFTMVRNAVWGD